MTIPRPDLVDVLTAWRASPEVILPLLVAAFGYWRAIVAVGRRAPRGAWPKPRTACFLAGLVVIAVALLSPIDRYADLLLWVHMIQHLLLMLVAAPLVLLGSPLLLAVRSLPPGRLRQAWTRAARGRGFRILGHPLLGWAVFVAVLAGTHFTPLYDAALEHRALHALEHALYLGGALLFWWPVVGRDPSAHRLSHPLRLLYLALVAPANTIIAVAIAGSGRVLYPHYAAVARDWGPSPLLDQSMAGSLMWVAGDLCLVAAAGLVLAGWMRHDRARSDREDARDDARRLADSVRRGAGPAQPGPLEGAGSNGVHRTTTPPAR